MTNFIGTVLGVIVVLILAAIVIVLLLAAFWWVLTHTLLAVHSQPLGRHRG